MDRIVGGRWRIWAGGDWLGGGGSGFGCGSVEVYISFAGLVLMDWLEFE